MERKIFYQYHLWVCHIYLLVNKSFNVIKVTLLFHISKHILLLHVIILQRMYCLQSSKAFVWSCSAKRVFLNVSQNSHESTCFKSLILNKVSGLRPATLLKKRVWHSYFPINFAKFLRTPFL